MKRSIPQWLQIVIRVNPAYFTRKTTTETIANARPRRPKCLSRSSHLECSRRLQFRCHPDNRTFGASKLKIREMGSRYVFIVLYCFIERLLSRGDYRRNQSQIPPGKAQ